MVLVVSLTIYMEMNAWNHFFLKKKKKKKKADEDGMQKWFKVIKIRRGEQIDEAVYLLFRQKKRVSDKF